jgi:hypothetical protein
VSKEVWRKISDLYGKNAEMVWITGIIREGEDEDEYNTD